MISTVAGDPYISVVSCVIYNVAALFVFIGTIYISYLYNYVLYVLVLVIILVPSFKVASNYKLYYCPDILLP
jgi:hypothetical protein